LRRKAPLLPRPYRTFAYPLAPAIYIVLALFVVLDLAYLAPLTSGIGYLLLLPGIPAYLIWRFIVPVSAPPAVTDAANGN
jgi:basic amino acid/polyamine antiporter, APA family